MQPQRFRAAIPETAALVALAAVLYGLLFTDPIVGLADHGDYFRIMNRVGLKWLTDNPDERYYWYVNRLYGHTTPSAETYHSSENYIAWIAVGLDNLLTGDEYFSIEAIGAVHAALFLFGVGLILFALRGLPLAARVVLAALTVFVYGDVGYVAWFNSLYSEPASQIFLFISLGLALFLAGDGSARRRRALGAAYYLAAFLFLTAKPQNGPCGVVLGALGFWLTLNPDRSRRRLPWTAAAALPGISILALSTWLTLVGQPAYMKQANIYDAIFVDLLKYSPAPAADMQELGIDDPRFVRLIGKDFYTVRDPFVKTPEFEAGFYDRIGYGKILAFYARHPGRFYGMIDRIARWAYTARPLSMGNYEHAAAPVTNDPAGHPPVPQLATAFSAWSRLKDAVFPKTGWFLLAFFLCNLAFPCAMFLRRKDRRARGYALVHLSIALLAGLQCFAAAIGQGESSIVKHLYLFDILFDGLVIILALHLAAYAGARLSRRG